MKKYLFIALAFVTACSTQSPSSESAATKIWEKDPIQCEDEMECLVKASENCTPAIGNFSTPQITALGENVTLEYNLGIQGESRDSCKLFYKVLSVNKAPTGISSNYTQCLFPKTEDLTRSLKNEPYHLIDDTLQLYIYPPERAKCERTTVVDKNTGNAEAYVGLGKGQSYEDASIDFRITLASLEKWPEEAILSVVQGQKAQEITLIKNQPTEIFDYLVTKIDFGQKCKLQQGCLPEDPFENAVFFYLSKKEGLTLRP